MNGKGHRNRTTNWQAFRNAIVWGKCSKHPGYTPGDRKPRCEVCRRVWEDSKREKP
jgi:hypothetical protein